MWVPERLLESRMIPGWGPGQLEKGLPPTELGRSVWEQQVWRWAQELSVGQNRKRACRRGGGVWRSEGHVDREKPLSAVRWPLKQEPEALAGKEGRW